jgi:hypothetical protein
MNVYRESDQKKRGKKEELAIGDRKADEGYGDLRVGAEKVSVGGVEKDDAERACGNEV